MGHHHQIQGLETTVGADARITSLPRGSLTKHPALLQHVNGVTGQCRAERVSIEAIDWPGMTWRGCMELGWELTDDKLVGPAAVRTTRTQVPGLKAGIEAEPNRR